MQFTVLPQNLTVNETNSILLNCDASGFPETSFAWTKNGKVLSRSKQLDIQKSYRNNTGTYECTASNGVGQDKTAKSFVTVQCKSTCHHDNLSEVVAKELLVCVTVRTITSSYVKRLLSEMILQHILCSSRE